MIDSVGFFELNRYTQPRYRLDGPAYDHCDNTPRFLLSAVQKRVPEDVLLRARGRSYPITLPAVGPTPEEIVEVTIRPAISFSLRVRDPTAVKIRVGLVAAQLEQIFAGVRNGPVELTHKKTLALAGEVYRKFVERFEEEPGCPEGWEAWKAFTWAASKVG